MPPYRHHPRVSPSFTSARRARWVDATDQCVRRAALGVVAAEVAEQALKPAREPDRINFRQSHMRDPKLGPGSRPLRADLFSSLLQRSEREPARLVTQIRRKKTLRRDHEQPSRSPVVLLAQRADLPPVDNADETRRLEHPQVMCDRAVRQLHGIRKLGRRRRTLSKQRQDPRPQWVGQCPQLVDLSEDKCRLTLVIVAPIPDGTETYRKYRTKSASRSFAWLVIYGVRHQSCGDRRVNREVSQV